MALKSAATATVRAVKPGSFKSRKAAITLTSSAVQRVKELLKEKPSSVGLRIGVRERGCNGLSYTLEYATEKNKFDEVVKQDDVQIMIDSKALMSLIGTEMDYSQNLLASEFVFNNPNIKGTCGCGESFHI
ncbi:iron-sulfur cluster assembly 1 homolog, mitochondrial isoform X1 [Hydra vulgaris]|nr:iron-sulfur cluster assembly 1 homolog, mitochondrial [Hydra vulgaris]